MIRFLLIAILLAACAPKNPGGGDEIGNGGDTLPKIFTLGREKAIRILNTVGDLAPSDVPAGLPVNQRIRDTYTARRTELLAEVSTMEVIWVPKNANSACGRTASFPGATVYLSYQDCRAILTATQAAIHLIGEAVHHLGIRNDEFTALASTSVHRSWERRLGLTETGIASKLTFDHGRRFASEVVSRIQDHNLAFPARGLVTETEWRDLIDKKALVSTRVLNATYDFVDELTNPDESPYAKCVKNVPGPTPTVQVSYTGCGTKFDNMKQAGALLIIPAIEAVLGVERTRASQIATAVYAAWANRGHPDDPHMLSCAPTPDEKMKDAPATWTGTEMISWRPKARGVQLAFYDPREDRWRESSTTTSYWDWFNAAVDVATDPSITSAVWVKDSLVVLTACHRDYRRRGAGHRYSPKTDLDKWHLVTDRDAPHRKRFEMMPVGEKVLVWGGEDCAGNREHDGVLYDPKADTWEKIPAPRAIPNLRGYSVTAMGNKILLWGGCEAGQRLCSQKGHILDLATKRWSETPTVDAPSARHYHQAFWTGKYFVVAGGKGPLDVRGAPTPVHCGGLLDLTEGTAPKWKAMNCADALDSDKLVWASPYLVSLGANLAFFHAEQNRWIRVPRSPVPRGRVVPFWTGMELLLWTGSYNYALYP